MVSVFKLENLEPKHNCIPIKDFSKEVQGEINEILKDFENFRNDMPEFKDINFTLIFEEIPECKILPSPEIEFVQQFENLQAQWQESLKSLLAKGNHFLPSEPKQTLFQLISENLGWEESLKKAEFTKLRVYDSTANKWKSTTTCLLSLIDQKVPFEEQKSKYKLEIINLPKPSWSNFAESGQTVVTKNEINIYFLLWLEQRLGRWIYFRLSVLKSLYYLLKHQKILVKCQQSFYQSLKNGTQPDAHFILFEKAIENESDNEKAALRFCFIGKTSFEDPLLFKKILKSEDLLFAKKTATLKPQSNPKSKKLNAKKLAKKTEKTLCNFSEYISSYVSVFSQLDFLNEIEGSNIVGDIRLIMHYYSEINQLISLCHAINVSIYDLISYTQVYSPFFQK